QRRDDLVRPEEGPQDPGDQRPRGTARAAGDDHRGDRERGRPAAAAEVEPRRGSGDRADEELALAADVEEPHPERGGGGEPGEGERRRRDERLPERAVRDEG